MIHHAPEHLDQAARAKWAEVLPILEGHGDVDQGTLDALAAYCSAWSRWTAAEQQVGTLGLVVKSPAGFPVANPYAAVAKDAQRQMRQWGNVLGLHNARARNTPRVTRRSRPLPRSSALWAPTIWPSRRRNARPRSRPAEGWLAPRNARVEIARSAAARCPGSTASGSDAGQDRRIERWPRPSPFSA